jgi:hypothetical protein
MSINNYPKVRRKRTVFDRKDEVIDFLEETFSEVIAKPIIDKKLNVIHEYYSNDKKIAYTEYQFDKKDEDKIKYRQKLVLVEQN